MKIGAERGKLVASEGAERTLVTVHPSSLLRAPDAAKRAQDYERFVADLRLLHSATP